MKKIALNEDTIDEYLVTVKQFNGNKYSKVVRSKDTIGAAFEMGLHLGEIRKIRVELISIELLIENKDS